MKYGILLIIVMFVMGCSGAQVRENTVDKKIERFDMARSSTSEELKEFEKIEAEKYILGQGDVIVLTPSNKENRPITNTINPDGMVNIENIGYIKASGKTIEDLEGEINEKIKKVFSNLNYTLTIEKIENNRVLIWGDVVNQGAVNIFEKTTLIEAIAMAGGIKKDGEKNEDKNIICNITRKNGKKIALRISELIDYANRKNVKLINGDIIYISKNEDNIKVYVNGEVNNKGIIEKKDSMELLEVLMKAGGISKDGDENGIYIIRYAAKEKKVTRYEFNSLLKKDVNIEMKDGDIVFVEKRGIIRYNNLIAEILPTFNLISAILNPLSTFKSLNEETIIVEKVN